MQFNNLLRKEYLLRDLIDLSFGDKDFRTVRLDLFSKACRLTPLVLQLLQNRLELPRQCQIIL